MDNDMSIFNLLKIFRHDTQIPYFSWPSGTSLNELYCAAFDLLPVIGALHLGAHLF